MYKILSIFGAILVKDLLVRVNKNAAIPKGTHVISHHPH